MVCSGAVTRCSISQLPLLAHLGVTDRRFVQSNYKFPSPHQGHRLNPVRCLCCDMRILSDKTWDTCCVFVQGVECWRNQASAVREEQPRGEATAAAAAAATTAAATPAGTTTPPFNKAPGERGHRVCACFCVKTPRQHFVGWFVCLVKALFRAATECEECGERCDGPHMNMNSFHWLLFVVLRPDIHNTMYIFHRGNVRPCPPSAGDSV